MKRTMSVAFPALCVSLLATPITLSAIDDPSPPAASLKLILGSTHKSLYTS